MNCIIKNPRNSGNMILKKIYFKLKSLGEPEMLFNPESVFTLFFLQSSLI